MLTIQYGVLPYIQSANKVKLVLITSRKSNKWIVPKGNRILKKSKHATALQEAFEEAGLRGRLSEEDEMHFKIKSHGKQVVLILYPMRVEKMLRVWPEKGQRKRLVVNRHKAVKIVGWPKFRRKLKSWNKR
jgi:8-oxo-dGTP pyrophosphatase MutT (NUDIX family)